MIRTKRMAPLVMLTAAGLAIGFGEPAAADGLKDADGSDISAVLWQGSDFANRSDSFWLGGAIAVNGDLTRNGFLLRAEGEYDTYSYLRWFNGNSRIDGVEWQGDAMVGYQVVFNTFSTAAYVGVDTRSDRLSPVDFSNSVRGAQTGARFTPSWKRKESCPIT